VTKAFLSNRSIFISPAQSAQIQKALVKIGVLDANGFIKYDVRFNRGWVKNLNAALPWLKRAGFNFNLISDESQIWQELNLAYSQHEIVSGAPACLPACLPSCLPALLRRALLPFSHACVYIQLAFTLLIVAAVSPLGCLLQTMCAPL
jgi:hypothetical protein